MHVSEPRLRWVYGHYHFCRSDGCWCICPNIIHRHALWKRGRAIRVARPISTDGDVQDQELRLIENPSASVWQTARGDREIELPIQEPTDAVLLPLDAIHVEIIA